jgi:hypothetical protein
MSAECTFVVAAGQGADNIAKLVDAIGNVGVIEYFGSPSGPRLETRRVYVKALHEGTGENKFIQLHNHLIDLCGWGLHVGPPLPSWACFPMKEKLCQTGPETRLIEE